MKKYAWILLLIGCYNPPIKVHPDHQLETMIELVGTEMQKAKPNESLLTTYFKELKKSVDSCQTDSLKKVGMLLYSKRDSTLRAISDQIQNENKAIREREESLNLAEREGFETTVRNKFLDMGLDIKVSVTGKKKDILTLKYALFSDVWLRKFEKEGIFDEWFKKGFKKITLTDGYDYSSGFSVE